MKTREAPGSRRCPGAVVPLAIAACSWTLALTAQTAPREGIQDRTPRVHALVGGRLVLAPGRIIDEGTIVLRDGLIEAVGAGVVPPADASVREARGLTITAGFIDLDWRAGMPAERSPQERQGRSWNPSINPERDVVPGLRLERDRARAHRAAGFTMAVVSPADGILAGAGVLIGLGEGEERASVVAERVAVFGSLERPGGGYPSSRMGAVALLRQTLHDAVWHREWRAAHARRPEEFPPPEANRSLEALEPVLEGKLPLALRTGDVFELLTLRSVVDEFRAGAWFLGSGTEYTWLKELAAAPVRLVIPVDFPDPPPVERPDDAAEVSLRDLELWARAPENGVRLHQAGIRFALTPRGLRSAGEFQERVRRMIARGLPAEAALAALTSVPAAILGLEARVGTLAPGKAAALAVFDGDPFAEGSRVREVWIGGDRYPAARDPPPDLRGTWSLALFARGGAPPAAPDLPAGTLKIEGSRESPSIEVETAASPGGSRSGRITVDGPEATLVLPAEPFGRKGFLRLGGSPRAGAGSPFLGSGRFEDGIELEFKAERAAPPAGGEKKGAEEQRKSPVADPWKESAGESLGQPLGARGRVEPPFGPGSLLLQGGTIWTCGPGGVIAGGDLLVEDGKVRAAGKGLSAPPGAAVVALGGRHVTPGIVDPHSHTAIIGGVNESAQAVSAEVRIGDVVWADDIGIYRQLAGGVTTAHLLHGSANPIGGQCAIVKYRWGEGSEGLKVRDPPRTIKFALGENVKQSNREGGSSRRYPQTRMGVEQILRDSLVAAREYRRAWEEHRRAAPGILAPAPRRDLELDALVEVLKGERLVHCHSYRQDEILMMMRLAEEMGFRVGTFQHVLEGYKVAPEIASHGAAASTFSDWWAYKIEVYDAIPYNGALLWRAGVLTSFNSDSDELARRLNLEAAKAVKYGGVPPEEALKFVTLNPALQIGMGSRIGSLEPGKDADFVIWSGSPLSTYSVCVETWIEGRRIFSLEEEARLRERDAQRHERLVQRLLQARHGELRGPDRGERKSGKPVPVPLEGEDR